MAVDIKTLRIGSHVEYEGKRVCADEIRTLRPDGEPMRLLVSYNGLVYGNPSIDEVEPIPITSALLKELGFEHYKKTTYREYYTKEIGEVRLVNIHGYQYRDKRITFYRTNYRNEIGEEWHCSIAEYNASTAGICIVRYLHEAESFLGLHNIELIKE